MEHENYSSQKALNTEITDNSSSEWLGKLRIPSSFAIQPYPLWGKVSKLFPALELLGPPKILNISGPQFQKIKAYNQFFNSITQTRNAPVSSITVVFNKLYFLIAKGYVRENFSICICDNIFKIRKFTLILHSSLGDILLDDTDPNLLLWYDTPYILRAIENINSKTGWAMILPVEEKAKSSQVSKH